MYYRKYHWVNKKVKWLSWHIQPTHFSFSFSFSIFTKEAKYKYKCITQSIDMLQSITDEVAPQMIKKTHPTPLYFHNRSLENQRKSYCRNIPQHCSLDMPQYYWRNIYHSLLQILQCLTSTPLTFVKNIEHLQRFYSKISQSTQIDIQYVTPDHIWTGTEKTYRKERGRTSGSNYVKL